MENFEKVEKIVERAGVSYEEAKQALEATNWDMLDAMIYIEKKGGNTTASYSTAYDANTDYTYEQQPQRNTAKKGEGFGEWLKNLLKKSDENHFKVCKKNGEKLIEIPIWLAIILAISFWTLTIILFIIGLFCGCSFTFVGPDKMDTANRVMDSCENAADSIRGAFTDNNNNNQ